jgi:2-keto-4-pentenoate hydratase/2-oxohepta-3-ene-1,7-dioic acid hydratase in catechol pathway
MKLAAYSIGKWRYVGIVDSESSSVQPFDMSASDAARGVLAIIERGAARRKLPPLGRKISLSETRLQAPIPRPRRNIFCIGQNYPNTLSEPAPDRPAIVSKVPESVVAQGEAIVIDRTVSASVDYGGSLAVIIGKRGRNISKARAMEHVWGYTIVNDVTARDLEQQLRQSMIAKSQDTFCPMGPWAVTADEIDLAQTRITTHVNDELRQNASAAELIFDIPTLIAAISNGVTLIPGDIIATGTPAGTGSGFAPPRFLKAGDRVRVEISRIGVLENPVRETSA